MAEEEYTLHKVWETPAIGKTKGLVPSPDFQINRLHYKLIIFTTSDPYQLVIKLENPPDSPHNCSINIKVVGRKKKEFNKNFVFSKTSPFCKIENFVSVAEMKNYSRKDKISIDFTIDHKNANTLPDFRTLTGHVGLINKSATCYMNSILQMLFHIPAFRRLIYSIPITEELTITHALQRLFCLLQFSPTSVSTDELIKSFGWTSREAFVEHDVQEFIRVLLSNLEEKLQKSHLDGKVAELFHGTISHYIKCINVDYQTSNKEDFYDLSITVRGFKDLNDSLTSFVADEILNGDNQYTTDDYGKQDALMGQKILTLPPVLHLHLTRFEYSATSFTGLEKVKDSFEFPTTLDLAPFVDDSFKGDSKYELFSVLVHIGDNMGGHYIAYCRPTSEQKWFRFNDAYIEEVDVHVAVDRNFGSPTQPNHAYYLCYIKKSDIRWVMQKVTEDEVPRSLMEYFEKERDNLDPKMRTVNVVNIKQKIKIAKDAPISNLMREIRKYDPTVKGLWTADQEDFPYYQIKLNNTVQDTLKTINRVFAADFKDFPTAVQLNFFFRGEKDPIQDLGFLPIQYEWNISKILDDVNSRAGYPAGTKLNCYTKQFDEIQPLNLDQSFGYRQRSDLSGALIFEVADDSKNIQTSFKFPEIEPGLIRARDVLPEIELNDIEGFIAHVNQCIKISIKDSNLVDQTSNKGQIEGEKENLLTIEIPYALDLSDLIKCIRKGLDLPEDESVLVYLPSPEDNSKPMNYMINTFTNFSLKEILRLHSSIKDATLFIKRVKGVTQEDANQMCHLSFQMLNEEMNEIADVEIDMPGHKTVADLFNELRKRNDIDSNANLRMNKIERSSIVRQIDENEQLDTLNDFEIRVEIVPENQLNLESGDFLIRCAFSHSPIYPPNATILKPFWFNVIKDEPFEITQTRIFSLIENDFGELSYILFAGKSSAVRLISVSDEMILSEDAQEPDAQLYIIISTEAVLKIIRQYQNHELKIYK
ncbi:Clan CA, family C19, ubiquitin hydrolase-like cysteine peptidase [Tritrichomonas foetus]|uniref:ubiquitinyl hydrolase 1 n=1 Tax=Tritrichomonas foetus TaxID=1144522 RepID=A0A1J4KXB7_9EUKA|nr:Clan CA, family C19, ubiquitin hydrolase-like cysteine peptidase [Tritrichomonas foetus]|eukprot:OHT15897.1 Clan CA, family C19, ubiquitin hydrolase-like cysteine peptidase [Tritrichomonas foetus]